MGRIFFLLLSAGALTVASVLIKHLSNNAINNVIDPLFGRKIDINDLEKGDHIEVKRFGYSHHGISIGNGVVIHYGGPNKDMNNAMVCQITSEDFANGGELFLVQHAPSSEETVKRAIACLGQKGYDLFENNCEHFANYCVTGKKESKQVDEAFSILDTYDY